MGGSSHIQDRRRGCQSRQEKKLAIQYPRFRLFAGCDAELVIRLPSADFETHPPIGNTSGINHHCRMWLERVSRILDFETPPNVGEGTFPFDLTSRGCAC